MIESRFISGSQVAEISGSEMDNLAAILGFTFVQRWDLQAQQRDDGRYVCIWKPLQHGHLIAHLEGEITLGMYLLNDESMGRHLVFDADDTPGWRRLQALAGVLSEMDVPSYLEASRRGGHLWFFFEELTPGKTIRKFGQGMMLYFGIGGIELFPKQSHLSGGPGSLIRMPFGIHRKAGCRYGFCDIEGNPLAPTIREQVRLMESPERVPQNISERFCSYAHVEQAPVSQQSSFSKASSANGNEIPLHERLKATVSVRDFVSRYIRLSRAGTGLCPLHDDHVESFSVDDIRNFWYCFACEKGGSIIDFWMHYRDCDFRTAVNQLGTMLL